MVPDRSYYERIIPTAWPVAYRRTLSDIPFSDDIFKGLDKLREQNQPAFATITEDMKNPRLAPQIEARYKLVNRLLLARKPRQVLEIAAGFAPRGLEMAVYHDMTFVEFDLPQVIRDKQTIIDSIMDEKSLKLKGKLFFMPGNALDYDSLQVAGQYLDRRHQLLIVNEGLLRYMNFDQKAAIADNVHRLLGQYGGAWITSDITLKDVMFNEDKNVKDQNARVRKMTGIDTSQNRFDDEAQAIAFFENHGFNVERHSFLEVKSELVSPGRLKMDEKDLKEMLQFPVVYVMTLKKD